MNGTAALTITADNLLTCAGCYISKLSYVRPGEKSLDNFYRPFHVVEYYRYVRFFPDGKSYVYFFPDRKSDLSGA